MDRPFRKREIEKCNLFEWISEHRAEEDMRDVFINMDVALKYIHEHGYCIEVFYPSRIEVLDNKADHIQFDNLVELSSDPIKRKDMIREDIFNSSLIQIGLYTNTFKSLTPEFLKDQFDEISRFLPEGDVPYYRGVVQRGASVYLSEFAIEKMKKDLEQLEKQVGEVEGGRSLVKSNGNSLGVEEIENDKINDSIYKQINGLNDVAFVNLLLIPTLVLSSLLLFAFIGWILSFI